MTTIIWLRKCLRLHDNPLLTAAMSSGKHFQPIFILDPAFYDQKSHQSGETKPHTGTGVGGPNANVFSFFLDTLHDLERNMETKLGKRMLCFKGSTDEVFRFLLEEQRGTRITKIMTEQETEEYGRNRDKRIQNLAQEVGIDFVTMPSHHTLLDPSIIIERIGGANRAPKTYQAFCKAMFQDLKLHVKLPLPVLEVMPSEVEVPTLTSTVDHKRFGFNENLTVPKSLLELGFRELDLKKVSRKYIGGESQGLERLDQYLKDVRKVCEFEKPKTRPNALIPDTTVLSPYITTGCLSVRTFYHRVNDIYINHEHTEPPVSLHGQVLFREYFYFTSFVTPNFHQMEGNPVCLQVPWKRVSKQDSTTLNHYNAWCHGRTGYPFIDACMRQLNSEGWIHHLARHAVACFLTRGDLWISWEDGRRYFDRVLLDGDYALNNANWMWLSASAFFTAYFRVYSPVAFGKKTDRDGKYIRKYVPELAKYPSRYIYEPWKAPKALQQSCSCIIGTDYPYPIVDHEEVKNKNMAVMKGAYRRGARGGKSEKIAPCEIQLNTLSPLAEISSGGYKKPGTALSSSFVGKNITKKETSKKLITEYFSEGHSMKKNDALARSKARIKKAKLYG